MGRSALPIASASPASRAGLESAGIARLGGAVAPMFRSKALQNDPWPCQLGGMSGQAHWRWSFFHVRAHAKLDPKSS
jgi:hypothetical protein